MKNKEKKKDIKEKIKNKSNNSGFAYTFKRKFMTDDTRTVLIVLILIAIFTGINLWVRSLNLAQVDVTSEKLYTLTDTSINAVKNIDKDIDIYVWGYYEDSSMVDLLKQYNKANSKINYQVVTRDNNKEIVDKYAFEEETPLIVIVGKSENHEKTEYIQVSDLETYDSNLNIVDTSEQKITNSILKVSTDDIPNICFLYGNEVDSSLEYFKSYLSGLGLYTTENLKTAEGKKFEIPEDCVTLVIPSLNSDLSKSVTDKIIAYINKGGNILLLNNVSESKEKDMPNYQSILDLYGMNFERDCILESSEYTLSDTQSFILSNFSSTNKITSSINRGNSIVLYAPGTIKFKENSDLAELKVSYEAFLYSSDNSQAINIDTNEIDDKGIFTIGATINKIVSDGVTSNAVAFSTQTSFSDYAAEQGDYPLFFYNEEVITNSIAYLADKGEYYSIGKLNTSIVPVNIVTTENQDYIIRTIISAIPIIIIILGCVVVINRNRKN